MARPCSICAHKQRAEIEEAMINRVSYRDIAKRFSLSSAAVSRHKDHIIKALTQAREARDVARADGLLLQVQDLQGRALNILTTAEEAEDFKTALGAIREARGCLELLAKLTGELRLEGTINILISPEWIELRAVIIDTLKPYPGIQAELARHLAEVEEVNNAGAN